VAAAFVGEGSLEAHGEKTAKTKLALDRLAVAAVTSGDVVAMTVEHVFANDAEEQLEGTFRFPLPEGAMLTGLALEIDGKLMDGELVNSCLVPFAQAAGSRIETIEGLGAPDALHPVQKSFLEHGGAQCGICTPGMVMASVALLRRCPTPNDAQIREGLAGNLCRCTGYMKIFDSVRAASEGDRNP
jgi:hypothetical protein